MRAASSLGFSSQPTRATDRAILELTFREAFRLGHNFIGTEHPLLAILDAEVENLPLSRLGLIKPDAESHLISKLRTGS